MSILVIFSLIVKCIGAVLEIASQALISQRWSVDTYGTYAFYVSVADGFYALLFSGIIKFNNYHISQGMNVNAFRKKYYAFYAMPICIVGLLVAVVLNNSIAICAVLAGFAYLCAMDTSSRMMSFGRYKTALFGEYCIGRSFVCIAILAISFTYFKNIVFLYIFYGAQFCIALVFYALVNSRHPYPELSRLPEKGLLTKYAVFQSTEIAHTIIMQTSVIVQYIFGGAYQTAIISIVLVVRKLINFITGPTSKLYQPEFARRFAAGDKKGLGDVYAQITRIQLCFMMPVFMLLIAKPEIILRVFNAELIEYGWLIRLTAIIFWTMIAFGPTSNFLPMTGKEKIDTIANWSSVAVMYLIMLAFHDNQYFVVIGFCAQILYINTFKLVLFCKYMKCLPMPLRDYFKILLIFFLASSAVLLLPSSLIIAVGICAIHFFANFIVVFPKEDLKMLLGKIRARRHTDGE